MTQTALDNCGVKRRLTNPVPRVFLGFALVFWLAPSFWSAWKGKPWVGVTDAFTYQESAEGLQARRVGVWWDQRLDAQGVDGKRFEIPERALFEMGAMGFRTRYDRILMESNRSPLVKQVRRRLAEHVFAKLAGARAADRSGTEVGTEPAEICPPVKSLMLMRTLWPEGVDVLANPAGEWNPGPALTGVKGGGSVVLGMYQLVDGQVVAMAFPKPAVGPEPNPTRADPRSVTTNAMTRTNPSIPGKPATGAAIATRAPQKVPLVMPPLTETNVIRRPVPWQNDPLLRSRPPGTAAAKPQGTPSTSTKVPPVVPYNVNGIGATRGLPFAPPAQRVRRPTTPAPPGTATPPASMVPTPPTAPTSNEGTK